ncbi:transcription factor bHLH149-like [Typha latifolia]|uniref:transcription factor bHLH149-like n=1 Tax=Typha latifolia TaxID=4733 RepID=UPI003C2DF418
MLSSSSSTLQKKPRSTANSQPTTKWRTPGQEQTYNRRLVSALRAAGEGHAQAPQRAAAVKAAADAALALTARGQSRWSRAILLGRRRRKVLLKAGGRIRRRCPARSAQPPMVRRGKGEEAKVGDRLRALGRLVPGCRKLAAGRLLEEAADYVAALEMQVRAMRALADAMSAAAISAPQASVEEVGDGEREQMER